MGMLVRYKATARKRSLQKSNDEKKHIKASKSGKGAMKIKQLKKKKGKVPKAIRKEEEEEEQNQQKGTLQQQDASFVDKVVRGGDDASGGAIDVFAGSDFVSSDNPFLAQYAQSKKDQVASAATEEELLAEAHRYFATFNAKEKRIHKIAKEKMAQMKRINKKGGDKDGFKMVVPKSLKQMVRLQKRLEEKNFGDGDDGEQADDSAFDNLQHAFQGDGIQESEALPMRRKKVRTHTYDDFYQFQVHKKWTKNAETFLSRGKMSKNYFQEKQKQRSVKKL